MDKKLEKLSAAVSLTVLEIDFSPNELIPAFLLANLMSPALWTWRSEKNAFNSEGVLLSPKSRLDQIQRFFHRYTFTNIPGEPGGDPRGLLNLPEEESFVSHQGKWIGMEKLSLMSDKPSELKNLFAKSIRNEYQVSSTRNPLSFSNSQIFDLLTLRPFDFSTF